MHLPEEFPHETIGHFHAALAARNPLHDPLPGTSESVYDGLTGCIH
ncbi:hypothetical protein JAK50_03200 [Stenotrophomonas maltophilia]|nr:hypothetical protein [Stenotrophomonas maltophilia]